LPTGEGGNDQGRILSEAIGSEILGVGLTGKELTDLERSILRNITPYAVVLFGRNIESAAQLQDLVAEVKSLSSTPPVMMIDEEGGRVDRLRNIVPGLPSAEAFAEGRDPERMSEWLGRVIGVALRYFDIEINLAPVVDIRGTDAPRGLERRCFGADAETVVRLAGAFIQGQQNAGVAACLKHFPGIGLGTADPHYGATVIDVPLEELERVDVVPFRELGNVAGAIMIGHGSYPQIDGGRLPATLSRKITTDLLRGVVGFHGCAVTDDMEMYAVSDLGSYEEISARALLAGNDVILYCSHIERVPDLQRYLRRRAGSEQGFGTLFDGARSRAQIYRDHCNRLRAAAGKPMPTFEAVRDEANRFCEDFQATRPEGGQGCAPYVERRKTPRAGTGRTGREEWT
jgi:beta-N-acetylhexosaminidase